MQVAILTPAIKKLSLRTDKHSNPFLDDLKATLFLVYAKQISIKGELSYVVVPAYNTDPQGSPPPPQLRVSIFSSPLYSPTDMYFCAHRFRNPCNFTIHNTQCPSMPLHSKNTTIYKKNVPHFHASPQFNLKIPGIIFFSFIYITFCIVCIKIFLCHSFVPHFYFILCNLKMNHKGNTIKYRHDIPL